MSHLREVLAAIREHGPRLKPIPGPVVRDRDEDGRLLQMPERGPSVPCARFSPRVEVAVCFVGTGHFWTGLEFLAQHPAATSTAGSSDGGRMDPNARRDAEALEKRWLTAWKDARV